MKLSWFVTIVVLLGLCSCIPPRDEVAAQPCNTNAQCPADGKHYCDLQKSACVPCNGTCPGAAATAVDTAVDTATAAETAADTAPLADIGGTCANRCGKYDEAASCNCDQSCADFDDCCADYTTLCSQVSSDAAADSDTSTTSEDTATSAE